jgi:hypothetical protein
MIHVVLSAFLGAQAARFFTYYQERMGKFRIAEQQVNALHA